MKGRLMGVGRKRSRGDAELDFKNERYLCPVWSSNCTEIFSRP